MYFKSTKAITNKPKRHFVAYAIILSLIVFYLNRHKVDQRAPTHMIYERA